MNIMITGAAGFLGRRLIDGLLQQDYLTDQQGEPRNINKIIAYDVLPLMEVEDPRFRLFVVTLPIRTDYRRSGIAKLTLFSIWQRLFPARPKTILI